MEEVFEELRIMNTNVFVPSSLEFNLVLGTSFIFYVPKGPLEIVVLNIVQVLQENCWYTQFQSQLVITLPNF